MKDKVITLLQELIRNKCINDGSMDSGHESRSAGSLRLFFKSYGIKAEILEPVPGRGSLLVRIPGTNPQAPSLMFMGHLDVVPANQEEWSCDPFAGDIRGGYVWGRGALDMLNTTAAAAVAFAELVSRQGQFPGDLIYLAEADEEASGRLGARWLVENHWDKVKADYIITEGGGFFIPATGDSGISIALGEKGMAITRIHTKGKAGHGSLPYRADNAAIKVAAAVELISKYRQQPVFPAVYRNLVQHLDLGWLQKMALRMHFTQSFALKILYKQNPGLAKQLHAVSRMTFSPNIIQAGNKINIIPDCGTLDLDIRLLPDQQVEDVINMLKKALGRLNNDYEVEIVDFFPSNNSPAESPLMKATREIVGTVYPGKICIPVLFSGVTDARFWRMRGATVYGFSLYDEDLTLAEYSRMLHGVDERVSIKSLDLAVNYFYKLPETFYRFTG